MPLSRKPIKLHGSFFFVKSGIIQRKRRSARMGSTGVRPIRADRVRGSRMPLFTKKNRCAAGLLGYRDNVESRRIIGKGSGAHLPALHCVLSRYAVTCVISVHVYISFKSISIFICRPSLSTATAARGSAFNGNHCSRPATSVGRQAVADRKSAISGRCCYLQI